MTATITVFFLISPTWAQGSVHTKREEIGTHADSRLTSLWWCWCSSKHARGPLASYGNVSASSRLDRSIVTIAALTASNKERTPLFGSRTPGLDSGPRTQE